MTQSITVGADPEFVLWDRRLNSYVSAHDLIPGTKEEPHPVNAGAIQVDGVAVEFNIRPAHSEDEFLHNIQTVLTELRTYLPPTRYDFHFIPSVFLPMIYVQKLPDLVRMRGCQPDFNGYTLQQNVFPEDVPSNLFGFGGHVHIGWGRNSDEIDEEHIKDCGRIARNLDHYLGIPSLGWDKDRTRRLVYGQAAAFRPKSYGVEYRTLSCAWLRSELLQRVVYRGAVMGTTDYLENREKCRFMTDTNTNARSLINLG